jgi:sialic acid synthase SpsE
VILIAELSTNHGGDVDLACDMVRQAAEAGADYAKIQSYDLAKLHPADPQRAWLTQAHLDEAAHRRIFQACKDAGIKPLSTPFDAGSLAMLRGLGLTTFKIASSESKNDWWVPLDGEAWFVSFPWGKAHALGSRNSRVVCHLAAIPLYPTPLEAVGRTESIEGWSDHVVGLAACQWAIANGAKVIEIHMHDTERRGRVCAWDKSPDQIRQLRQFADDCLTMTSGVATTFRRRWTA